jgi:DNA-binding response OmpR family regulator
MEAAPCVLIVDDDEGVRETFAYVLTLEGYSVRIAATAEEALAYVDLDRPDAILVDLKMPMINGAGFLFRLRKDPANRDIAVAVITAEPAVDDATVDDLKALRAKVWHKPLSIEEIQQIARALMADAAATRKRAAADIHTTAPSVERPETHDAPEPHTRH